MNVLVLGNGLLGGEIVKQTNWDFVSRESHGIEFTKPNSYEQYVSDWENDIVVNCIGYTNTYDPNKEPSWSVNFTGVIDLVNLCNKYGKKLVHISTDYIFTGSKNDATENDVPVHFDNWYAYTKLLADGYVQAKCRDYLLVRCSFKPRPFPWDEGWEDLRGNFDYVDVIASLIIRLIESGAGGVYNVGTARKTTYQLALQTKADCVPVTHIHAPFDITMNINKLNESLNNRNNRTGR